MAEGSQKQENSGKDWTKAGAGVVWEGHKGKVERPVVKGDPLSTLLTEPHLDRCLCRAGGLRPSVVSCPLGRWHLGWSGQALRCTGPGHRKLREERPWMGAASILEKEQREREKASGTE